MSYEPQRTADGFVCRLVGHTEEQLSQRTERIAHARKPTGRSLGKFRERNANLVDDVGTTRGPQHGGER
jgi:hypothetical protein